MKGRNYEKTRERAAKIKLKVALAADLYVLQFTIHSDQRFVIFYQLLRSIGNLTDSVLMLAFNEYPERPEGGERAGRTKLKLYDDLRFRCRIEVYLTLPQTENADKIVERIYTPKRNARNTIAIEVCRCSIC